MEPSTADLRRVYDADLLELPTPGFVRLEVRLLHEEATPDLHPQVLTLAASTGPRPRDDR